jgi:hypothetical protein
MSQYISQYLKILAVLAFFIGSTSLFASLIAAKIIGRLAISRVHWFLQWPHSKTKLRGWYKDLIPRACVRPIHLVGYEDNVPILPKPYEGIL